METEIGGYFGLELKTNRSFLHSDGLLLNSGKNALRYILEVIPDIEHIWIPFYTCPVIHDLIHDLHIPCSFYTINKKLEMADEIQLVSDKDFLLITNYFGLKDMYIEQLYQKYGGQLIVDNSQAWYANPLDACRTFYSPRKYVGVPDGGIAYFKGDISTISFPQSCSYDRCQHLLKRYDLGANGGYVDFKKNDTALAQEMVQQMSKLTICLLSSIDFDDIKDKRWKNFNCLHQALSCYNEFTCLEEKDFACPMVYPFLTKDSSLKNYLIDHNVYVATYWPSLNECDKGMTEYDLVDHLIAIPIDQRYGEEEMKYVIQLMENACVKKL